MNFISISQARSNFAEILNKVFFLGDRYVIRKRNKNIGAFVPIEDLELLESLEDTLDSKAIDKIIANEEFIDWEDAKKALE
jgi:prevent-host-death family protein